MNNQGITWHCKHFSELTITELYDMLQLRSAIFVVEQNCVFLDIDGIDKQCHHLFCYQENDLVACCRVMDAGVSYAGKSSIGRVVNAASVRGSGIGKIMMQKAIELCRRLYPSVPVKIGAQLYLKRFYGSLGFVPSGDVYLEDGILHVHMELQHSA